MPPTRRRPWSGPRNCSPDAARWSAPEEQPAGRSPPGEEGTSAHHPVLGDQDGPDRRRPAVCDHRGADQPDRAQDLPAAAARGRPVPGGDRRQGASGRRGHAARREHGRAAGRRGRPDDPGRHADPGADRPAAGHRLLHRRGARRDQRRVRREHDPRGLEHKLRHAGPALDRRRVPAHRHQPRADQRDHGCALAADRPRGQGRRPAARPRRMGGVLDRRPPRPASRRAGRGPGSTAGCHMTVTDDVAPGPVRVNLLFNERQVRVPYGVTLFDAASWNGIAIDSTCGGHGTCKKCQVRIANDPPAPTSLDIRAYTAEKLKQGWRLACRTTATRDAAVEVPPLTTRPKAATVGVGRQVILRPAVQKRYLELTEPTLTDQASDVERVLAQLEDLEPRAELSVLKTLGRTLREADYKVTAVVVDDVLIAVEPGDTTQRRFGIAFDLGTTTVVATLLDLSTGTPVAVESTLNNQQPFGADVISRISATMLDPSALDKLQQLAQETLAELARTVCQRGAVQPREVYEVAVASNATMTHLALGIDPEPLGMAPFILSARLFPEILAADLGLADEVHPGARAVVFPAFGAYVGGDITAGLLASGMDQDARVRLFLDIGTNCEIVLGNRDWLLATAAPAGPAFEGAAIRCGMRAADGAIEVVTMTPDELTLKVIGDAEPQGLCGSGLVDAVTGLVKVGLLDSSGRFIPEEAARDTAPGLASRLTSIGKERVFVLHWRGPGDPENSDPAESIYLSQRDVRGLQFAKAAIATGWQILLEQG